MVEVDAVAPLLKQGRIAFELGTDFLGLPAEEVVADAVLLRHPLAVDIPDELTE